MPVLEHTLRVLVTFLTAGFPPEILRVLGLVDGHLREARWSALVLVLLAIPTVAAIVNAFRCWSAIRVLCLLWIAGALLPLVLMRVTPESYHWLPALPPIFILWLEMLPTPEPLPRDTWHES